jgi:hypothetical protein
LDPEYASEYPCCQIVFFSASTILRMKIQGRNRQKIPEITDWAFFGRFILTMTKAGLEFPNIADTIDVLGELKHGIGEEHWKGAICHG